MHTGMKGCARGGKLASCLARQHLLRKAGGAQQLQELVRPVHQALIRL
jgi:hypothetical protein